MSFCYYNDGRSMRAVDPDYQPQDGEVAFDHYASDAELDDAFPGRADQSLLDLRARQLAAIKDRADELLASLEASYPEREVKSWSQQTREAEALAVDPAAVAPLLNGIAAARGVPLLDLAGRVRAKVAAAAELSGPIIGQRQALEDALMAVDLHMPDAAEQLEAIQWPA